VILTLANILGETHASGTSSRMCRSAFPSRLASTANLAIDEPEVKRGVVGNESS
jgi:hypothetical protein